ncbi:hypothetical protein H7849_11805 [Alloacidobacterium dinghuense]|uniref:Uncharacterized protein n=1 Tax=Alloacidobacterium dinghuense TaxID=2763107 RepID=A0A7G8BPP0_9BACT|nr:hypothetical protein [Alloacidobacterium dinghuense]QNI34510.1 hypothetical protein H7849_11805 [Alloacidobacterium dinghuense]
MRVDIFMQREGAIVVARQKQDVDITVSLAARRRMRAADRLAITAIIFAVLWLACELLPALFDGRIAQVVR